MMRLGTALAGLVAAFLAAVSLYLYLDRSEALRAVLRAEAVLAKERQAWAEERQRLTAEALAESERARKIEAQWRDKQSEVVNHAQSQIRAAAADAARARDAAGLLRQRAEALAAQCSPTSDQQAPDPSFAGRGQAAPDPGAMLADLLGRLAKTAGELAAIADARGASGSACERSYEALKQRPT
jgi:hypothetical protein